MWHINTANNPVSVCYTALNSSQTTKDQFYNVRHVYYTQTVVQYLKKVKCTAICLLISYELTNNIYKR